MNKLLTDVMDHDYQELIADREEDLFFRTCLELCLETIMDLEADPSDIKYIKCEYEDDHCTIFHFRNVSDDSNIHVKVTHDEAVFADRM